MRKTGHTRFGRKHHWLATVPAWFGVPLEVVAQPSQTSEVAWVLVWQRLIGAEDCLDGPGALSQLEELSDRVLWLEDDQPGTGRLEITLSPAGPDSAPRSSSPDTRWNGTIQVWGPEGLRGERHFESAAVECRELAEQLVLAGSMAVTPDLLSRDEDESGHGAVALADPAEAQSASLQRPNQREVGEAPLAFAEVRSRDAVEAPASELERRALGSQARSTDPDGSEWVVNVEGGALLGILGKPAAFLEAALRWRWLRIAALVSTPVDAADDGAPQAVETWLAGGSVGLCPLAHRDQAWALTLCGTADGGVMRGGGATTQRAESYAPFFASRVGVFGGLRIFESLWLSASLTGGAVWFRPRFEAGDGSDVVALMTAAPWLVTTTAGVSFVL